MATIKSTITLQSSGLFPGNINSTSINTTELSSSSSLQTVNVYKQFGEGSAISNSITAAHGAILYAQSPASNKRNICIYSVSSIFSALIATEFASEYPGQFASMPTPLMTLRPGESAMTRISIDSNQTDVFGPGPTTSIVPLLEGTFDDLSTFFSSVTPNLDDVATLDYILAEQGGTVGTSIGVLTTTANNDRWQHQVMDFEKGTMSQLTDLDLPTQSEPNKVWDYSNTYGIHEKGYLLEFHDSADADQYSYKFIGLNGERVGDIYNKTVLDWHPRNKSAVVVYRDSTELVFTVFDGLQLFEHRLVAESDVYRVEYSNSVTINTNELCMADGSVVVTVTDNDDAARTYILSEGNEPAQIFTGTYDVDHVDNVDFYISEFADTVIVADYSGGVYYETVQIWNKSGIKVKEIDLTGLSIDTLDVYPYGSGCWAIVGTPNATYGSDLIQLFAYDQSTGILHGEDLNWQVDSAVYTQGVVVVCEPKHLLASYDEDRPNGSFDNESLAFIAYDNLNYNANYFLDQASAYLKVFTLFPGKATPTEHDLAVDTTIFWRRTTATADGKQSGIYPTSKYIRLHVSSTDRDEGLLKAVTIKPGTASPVYTTVANLAQINTGHNDYYYYNNQGISYSPFGDYSMYAFYTTGTTATSYRVLDARGNILDTLTTPGSHTSIGWNGFRTRYNSLLIRTLDGAAPTSYFNTKTKKFVTLPETYRNHNIPNLAWRSHINNGVMLLRDSNSTGVVPKYWRILTQGTVSPKITLPSQFSPESNVINYYMGETYLFLWFKDTARDDKWTFLVYDLAGVLVNTVLTNYEYIDATGSKGNRLAAYLYPANYNNILDQWCMITPTSSIANYWTANEVNNFWYNLNDAKYND